MMLRINNRLIFIGVGTTSLRRLQAAIRVKLVENEARERKKMRPGQQENA